MPKLRREKRWAVAAASSAAVKECVVEYFSERGVVVTADSGEVVEGHGGSPLKAFFLWTDTTAPYRVRVGLWDSEENGRFEVEATFEERTQLGKAGPVKSTKYTKLGDDFLDGLRAHLQAALHRGDGSEPPE
jgi:hypothetical protein